MMNEELRTAVARVLVNLVKSDRVVEEHELRVFDEARASLSIRVADEERAMDMTLGRALEILSEADTRQRESLMRLFGRMVNSDGVCVRSETLLMVALQCCLEDRPRCNVISHCVDQSLFDDRQVLYVESSYSESVNRAMTVDFRSIANELRLLGFDLVYLPEVTAQFRRTDPRLSEGVMRLLEPSLGREENRGRLDDLRRQMCDQTTERFTVRQLANKLGFAGLGDTEPALLVRIGTSRVGGNIYADFMRVLLSADVLADVRALSDRFAVYPCDVPPVSPALPSGDGAFAYSGFYRQLFEILLRQQQEFCTVVLDSVSKRIFMPEPGCSLSGVNLRERALYTLMVYYQSREGGMRFNGAAGVTEPRLADARRRQEVLMARYAHCYRRLGGNPGSVPDITDPETRNPMISKIGRGFRALEDRVSQAAQYAVRRDDLTGRYRIKAPINLFKVYGGVAEGMVDAVSSPLFMELDAIR